MTTPSYSKATPAAYSVFPATCLPPPRPFLRPMVTPPTSSVPLPANLRHHHNYRRPEQSQIESSLESTESFIVPARAVKGCDGIVRTNARPTYAQMRPSYEKTKTCPQNRKRRAARCLAEDLRYEVRFRRARLTAAIIASCTTAEKGRVLYKRNIATAYTSTSHQRKSEAVNAAGKKRIHIQHARRRPNTGFLGPLAGHVLRICFCQPYDGAGETTHDVAANTLCTSNHNKSMHEKPNKVSPHKHVKDEVEADAALPNARVVTSTDQTRNTINSTRKRTNTRMEQSSSAFSTNHATRTRGHGDVGVASALKTSRGGR